MHRHRDGIDFPATVEYNGLTFTFTGKFGWDIRTREPSAEYAVKDGQPGFVYEYRLWLVGTSHRIEPD